MDSKLHTKTAEHVSQSCVNHTCKDTGKRAVILSKGQQLVMKQLYTTTYILGCRENHNNNAAKFSYSTKIQESIFYRQSHNNCLLWRFQDHACWFPAKTENSDSQLLLTSINTTCVENPCPRGDRFIAKWSEFSSWQYPTNIHSTHNKNFWENVLESALMPPSDSSDLDANDSHTSDLLKQSMVARTFEHNICHFLQMVLKTCRWHDWWSSYSDGKKMLNLMIIQKRDVSELLH
jgi:hypothetical protein